MNLLDYVKHRPKLGTDAIKKIAQINYVLDRLDDVKDKKIITSNDAILCIKKILERM